MQVTTYTCDKCGKSSTDQKELDLLAVGIFVGHYEVSYSYGREPRVKVSKEWCRECRENAGLIQVSKDKPQPPTISIEDMLRDIINEEIDNRKERS